MTLEEKANQLVSSMTPVLEKIPGVVIVHYLNPHSVLYMSQNGLRILGVSLQELQGMGAEYYDRFFNIEEAVEYVPKVLGMVERNDDDELISFFQQVRSNKSDNWEWYTSGTRIFMHDDEGKPYLTITVAIPIDVKHYFSSKIERLLKENELLRRNRNIFGCLTKREKEILALMARDMPSTEIATTLFIAENTVNTHRRNIKKKLNITSHYDVVTFAQAFDLI